VEAKMQRVLSEAMGIVRTGAELESGLEKLRALPDTRRVVLARALVRSALERRESRGAHVRSDFPETSEDFRRTTVVALVDGEPQVSFREIPELREVVS